MIKINSRNIHRKGNCTFCSTFMSRYNGDNLEQTYVYYPTPITHPDKKIKVTVTNEGYSTVKKVKPYECKNRCKVGNGLSVTNDVTKTPCQICFSQK